MAVVSTNPGGVIIVGPSTTVEIKEEPVDVSKLEGVKNLVDISYEDIGGLKDEVKKVREMIEIPLKKPELFDKLGISPPKGVLMHGPPGTGKTLLAKAVANETNATFIKVVASEFVKKYIGEGARMVREVFELAKEKAPSIIFIDELDAVAAQRLKSSTSGDREVQRTLMQLLAELDGFESRGDIGIIGATNRPEILDKALLRPGRFDRRIIVDKPDLKGRVEILKVHAKDVHMDETVDLDAIALATSGAVGSDLANMINEAAINAVKEGRECVNQHDLFNAVEVVLVGKEKKDRIMSKEERKIVSYHEVGHALIAALQKNSEPVQKITIVPRTMGALGYVMHVPEEEKYLNTEAELRDMLVSLVGGRAAEEVVFGNVTTGAANDIERATAIARNMVTRFGMSKRFGLIGLATVVTPNLPEAKRLYPKSDDIQEQASYLMAQGAKGVLVKGGHGDEPDVVVNRWFSKDGEKHWQWHRLPGEFHGTGCTLASAIAGYLAQGLPEAVALEKAQQWCQYALAQAFSVAEGQQIPGRHG